MEISVDELIALQFLQPGLDGVDGDDNFDAENWYVGDADPEDDPEAEGDPESANQEESVSFETQTNFKRRTYLNHDKRKQLILDLFSSCDEKLSLRRGVMKELAGKYHVSRFTVSRIWMEAVRQKKAGVEVIVSTKKHKCGRRAKFEDDQSLIDVPLKQRTTIRAFAKALDVSVSTVHRLIQKGIIRSHSNAIKPKLSPQHQILRMKFILKFVIPATLHQKPRFDLLYNMIHIDEKWFFMTKTNQRFYLLSEEEDPYRSCQSKGFITKVMFMAAIARPWMDETGQIVWDGKIGIFPFTEEVAAQRGSINRPRGTLETKPIQHINKDTIRRMILEKLLPKIREKWPSWASKTIWIQQDNARPHIQPTDPLFLEAAQIEGFDIKLIQQPAQSPDLNILDLGFFRAIQSIQHHTFPDTVLKLIKSVGDAYESYNPRDINHTWLHLMYVMVEVLKVKGGNNYKMPHVGKNKLERAGQLPKYVEVEEELLSDVIGTLNADMVFGSNRDVEEFQSFEG